MFCRRSIGMGRIGHELHWPRIVLVMDCIGMGRTGSGCIALDHFVPRKRFIRNKVLSFKSASIYITGNLKNIPDMDLHIETR